MKRAKFEPETITFMESMMVVFFLGFLVFAFAPLFTSGTAADAFISETMAVFFLVTGLIFLWLSVPYEDRLRKEKQEIPIKIKPVRPRAPRDGLILECGCPTREYYDREDKLQVYDPPIHVRKTCWVHNPYYIFEDVEPKTRVHWRKTDFPVIEEEEDEPQ